MGTFLNEAASTEILLEAGVPMGLSKIVQSVDEARAAGTAIGGTLVLKVLSPDILHKSDAGCVFVGVEAACSGEVFEKIMENARAYDAEARIDGVLIRSLLPQGLELFVGLKRDPQFGPVVVAGMGGIYLEVFKDCAMRLAPVDAVQALDMVKELKAYQVITGARGVTYDVQALVDAIVKVSQLGLREDILELDINPFFLYQQGGVGADALVQIK